jgi:hypothetical protein
LFIIARPAVKQPGSNMPPIAVQRIDSPVFPLAFSLTNANNMIGEDFYDGDITLTVRLDVDGKAGAKQPNDLESTMLINAQENQRQVQLTLKR